MYAIRSYYAPVKPAHFPQINQTEKQDDDEKTDLGESGPAEQIPGHRPGYDEDRFDVEDDEKDGHQIERNRFHQPCRAGRSDARLVSRITSYNVCYTKLLRQLQY